MRALASILALSAVLAAASACGGGGSTGPEPSTSGGTTGGTTNNPPPPGGTAGAATVTAKVGNNFFNPSTLTVAPGTVVKWTWDTCDTDPYYGQTCVSHNVTLDDGSDASPVQSAGSFSHTFSGTGTYDYHCSVHGPAMAGKVVVQ